MVQSTRPGATGTFEYGGCGGHTNGIDPWQIAMFAQGLHQSLEHAS